MVRSVVRLRWFLLCVIVFSHGCERASAPTDDAAIARVGLESENGQAAPQQAAPTPPTSAIADPQPGRFRLVMVGDSITAGFGLPAPEALPVKLQSALDEQRCAITIVDAGVSGDTTADGLNRFGWSVDPDADGVLIALGGNDLLQGIAPDQTRANLAAMIEKAKARDLQVILAGMRAPGNYGTTFQDRFDAIFPDLAATYDIALYPFLLEGVGAVPSLNQPDGIHPNRQGVAKITDAVSTFLCDTVKAMQ
ncbi:MAG: arylesterase [Pseudomonadota bacterium]